ncbi:hypothetical protein WN55_10487 [Dufourea novaeangliae]|uniref:Uncharacterized protein n=1 Tax=Dufourea novaeangliae TaxID=178035 RepID=A0A154P3T4_DUFNO|nr:hypothetical protein WN55_10487 [Dufourea novaeangliae]
MYGRQTETCKLMRSIFLPFYHHVHQVNFRLFTDWFHVFTVPPTLLEKLESYEFSEIQTQVSNCLMKVYALCNNILHTVHDYSVPMVEVVRNLKHKVARYFPESTVIEYLLRANTSILMTVEVYLRIYSQVPFMHLYPGNDLPVSKKKKRERIGMRVVSVN